MRLAARSRVPVLLFVSWLCILLCVHEVKCGEDDYDPCKAGRYEES